VNAGRPRPLGSRSFILWATASASVAALALWWSRHAAENDPPAAAPPDRVTASSAAGARSGCPPDHLPDDDVCLPLPAPEPSETETQTRIDLLPGRPPEYARYLTPIAAHPASAPRQGLGVFIAAPRGTPITALMLEGQAAPTRVAVTATTPPRLLTLHRTERAGSVRTYVLIYDGIAFDTPPGTQEVSVGTPLGRVSAGDGATGLGLGVRQFRRDLDPGAVPPERLLLDATTIVCDPRNVLPLAPPR
jgi:hypothetical protein